MYVRVHGPQGRNVCVSCGTDASAARVRLRVHAPVDASVRAGRHASGAAACRCSRVPSGLNGPRAGLIGPGLLVQAGKATADEALGPYESEELAVSG